MLSQSDNHFNPLSEIGPFRFWSKRTLRILLEEAGFRDLRLYPGGRIPLLAKSLIVTAVTAQPHRPAPKSAKCKSRAVSPNTLPTAPADNRCQTKVPVTCGPRQHVARVEIYPVAMPAAALAGYFAITVQSCPS